MRGWGVPILGAVTGLSLYLSIGTAQVLLPVTSSPILTVALTAGVPVALWLWLLARRKDVRVSWLGAGVVAFGAIAAVTVFRALHIANWSFDSIQYLVNASLIATGNFDEASTGLVPKRLIGVPLLHAGGTVTGDFFLPSLTPLIAGLVVALIAWLAWVSLSRKLGTRMTSLVVVIGVLFMVSMNRFIFHAFYINGHLLFGLLLLAVVGCSWLITVDDRVNRMAMMLVVLLASIPLIVIRAEGCIAVALAILPVLIDHTTPTRFKTALLALVGGCAVAWQAFVATAYLDEGLSIPFSVFGLMMVGGAMVAAIPLLHWPSLKKYGAWLLWIVELGLWLVLAVLFLREPEILVDSVRATIQNAVRGSGSWGASLVILFALMVVVLFMRVPHSHRLRFPLTTFIPFGFLLAYLRDAAYRVGDGDSLNRMWIQLIPLAVFYLIVAIGGAKWRFQRRSSQAAQSTAL